MIRTNLVAIAALAITASVGIAALLAQPGAVETQSHSANRSFPADWAAPGGEVQITITTGNLGGFGQVEETLPEGFTFVRSSLDAFQVSVTGQTVLFTLIGGGSFTYVVTAPAMEGRYTFSGIVKNADREERSNWGPNHPADWGPTHTDAAHRRRLPVPTPPTPEPPPPTYLRRHPCQRLPPTPVPPRLRLPRRRQRLRQHRYRQRLRQHRRRQRLRHTLCTPTATPTPVPPTATPTPVPPEEEGGFLMLLVVGILVLVVVIGVGGALVIRRRMRE